MNRALSVGSHVILQIEDVNRTYNDANDRRIEALQNINLSVRRGEFLSIIGSSGCGKTTLLRLIAGLDRPQSGRLTLKGEPITGRTRNGVMFFNRAACSPG